MNPTCPKCGKQHKLPELAPDDPRMRRKITPEYACETIRPLIGVVVAGINVISEELGEDPLLIVRLLKFHFENKRAKSQGEDHAH